jgi:hypothetical protein
MRNNGTRRNNRAVSFGEDEKEQSGGNSGAAVTINVIKGN